MNFRVGHGYDVHRLVEGRPLWLGGIHIPCDMGLDGHSDADVLIHAICDALLGAMALGDIGSHFPDSDDRFKGIDSKVLLAEVNQLLQDTGYVVSNIDATLVMEEPKMAQFISVIRETLADVLDIPVEDISVKATTTEGLGPEGRREGIAAHAVAMIRTV